MAERRARTLPGLMDDWASSRHASDGWPQFLEQITIFGLRGWIGQTVDFRFPVTVIAGENGSGKSTVLKAAATAYSPPASSAAESGMQAFFPADFFPTTPWESVKGVFLGYQVRQGTRATSHSLRKPTTRWRGTGERPERAAYFLDISRTQPIDTLIGYGRLVRAEIARSNVSLDLNDRNRQRLSRILGRTYDDGRIIRNTQGKQVGLVSASGVTYSNFHQGAGEDATTDLIALLQSARRNSLVIIDEVEASLHPRAQKRLMAELIELARSARMQFILSTHSPYILEQVPTEARVYIQADRFHTREIIYGASPLYALSLMDDDQHPELTVYCEDKSSEFLIEAIIGAVEPSALKRIQIIPVGPANVVRTLASLSRDGRIPTAGVGVVDADQGLDGCIRLPGTVSPEREVFESLTPELWGNVAKRIAADEDELANAFEDATRLDDPHTWSTRIANGLHSGMRASRVWEAAASVWVLDVLSDMERKDFFDLVTATLPAIGKSAATSGADEQSETPDS